MRGAPWCLLMLAVFVPRAVRGAETAADQRRTIAVTGQAEVKTKPDRVVISFGVETVGARAGEAVAENAKRSAAVADALKRLLGPDDVVRTSRYGVDPRYEPARPGEAREPRITGYVAHNDVEVTSAKIDQAGALVDAATAAGANRIGGLQFAVAGRDEVLRRALEQAGAEARAQADSLARGLGVRVKGVLSAVSSASGPVMPRRFEAMEMATARTATPIEAGESSVTASVQVTFEIE